MKRILKVALVVIFLLAFFFWPIFSSDSILQTSSQKALQEKICQQHGCGLVEMITPLEFIKESFLNLVVYR